MNIQADLGLLEKAGLVQPTVARPQLAYAFRHGLIQDAAYSTLLRSQRRQWHQAAGEVLESDYLAAASAPDEALAPVLGEHFAIAGDDARAVRYFERAADSAFARYANVEAAAFYARALELALSQPANALDPARLQALFLHNGQALEKSSRYEAALQCYAQMEQVAQARGQTAMQLAAVTAQATIYSTANLYNDPAEGQRLLEQAARLAAELNDRAAQAGIYWNLLLLATTRGDDAAERVRYGERSLALARELDLREQTALTLTDIWYGYAGLGQWERARRALEEAAALGRQVDNPSLLPEALMRLSVVALAQGDYDAAAAYSDESYQVALARNSLDLQGLSRAMVGSAYFERGEFDTAIRLMEAAVQAGLATGNVTVLTGTRGDLGRVYGELGMPARGLELALNALADAEARFPLLAAWARANVVRLHLYQEDVARAEAAAATLEPFEQARRKTGFIAPMWIGAGLAAGELALARGDAAQATRGLTDLVETLRADGLRYGLPDAFCWRARAHLALGELALARADLRQAASHAQALGGRRILWQVLVAQGDVDAQSGLPEAAADARRQARRLVQALAQRAPTVELRSAFLAQPRVRALLEEADQERPTG